VCVLCLEFSLISKLRVSSFTWFSDCLASVSNILPRPRATCLCLCLALILSCLASASSILPRSRSHENCPIAVNQPLSWILELLSVVCMYYVCYVCSMLQPSADPAYFSWKSETTKILIHSFVNGRLDYCNSFLVGISDGLIQKLVCPECGSSIRHRAAEVCQVTETFRELYWLHLGS